MEEPIGFPPSNMVVFIRLPCRITCCRLLSTASFLHLFDNPPSRRFACPDQNGCQDTPCDDSIWKHDETPSHRSASQPTPRSSAHDRPHRRRKGDIASAKYNRQALGHTFAALWWIGSATPSAMMSAGRTFIGTPPGDGGTSGRYDVRREASTALEWQGWATTISPITGRDVEPRGIAYQPSKIESGTTT